MKMFLSAAEIAALKLPGLPTVKRAVNRLAQSRQWSSRPREGRGGGVEYAVESLPPEARIAYVGQNIDAIEVPASVAREAASEPNAIMVGGSAAQGRDARLAILSLADSVAAQAGVKRKKADVLFCDLYNTGRLDVAPWIAAEVKGITTRTLARWRALDRAGQKSKLAFDRAAARRGTGSLDRANDGEVRTYILALMAKQQQLTAHHIRSLVADRFPKVIVGGKVVSLPPIRTFQYTLNAWKAT